MLDELVSILPAGDPQPLISLSCTGITESDAQVRASDILLAHPGVALTMLAGRGGVTVVLRGEGASSDEVNDDEDISLGLDWEESDKDDEFKERLKEGSP